MRNNVVGRDGVHSASTLIVCGEWNELGIDPQNPVQRRRVNIEPTHYLVLEEDWTLRLNGGAEVALWLKIRQEWDQVYLWEEDGPQTGRHVMLGQLTEPPRINLARGEGGITEVRCTWRTLPAPFNIWNRI